jgi:hypothetical protein
MRSIGKARIKKLQALVKQELARPERLCMGIVCHLDARDEVMKRIPADWYDTWESAHTEIENIVDDVLMEFIYRR